MNPAPTPGFHPFLAGAAALGFAGLASLTGCLGGTSTGAENPGIVMEFREGGQSVPFTGTVQFFESNSNPEFVAEPPADQDVDPDSASSGAIPTLFLTGQKSYFIERDTFARLVNPHPYLGLEKSSAGSASGPFIPDFNIILGGDGKAGYLAGVHIDSGAITGDGRLVLPISLTAGRDYTGTVDNGTSAGRALALFVPGTTYFARVKEDDGFTFTGIPAGRLPLRWVSLSGIVYDMADSLGGDWTHPLLPGPRQDSIRVPPVLPAPEASPPGKFSFSDSVAVTLASEPGAAIHYTLDGNTPTAGSPLYTGPVVLKSSGTLKAVAFLKGWLSGSVSVNNYELVPYQPTAAPAGGPFEDSVSVVLSDQSRNATIRYTLNGSDPGEPDALVYHQPIVLRGSTTLKALAVVPGLAASSILEAEFTLLPDSLAQAP